MSKIVPINLGLYNPESVALRFWSKVRKQPCGCWEWLGGRKGAGYGTFGLGKGSDGRLRTANAHRIAYWLATGTDPAGMLVCHSCDNPTCCRPDHLWLGTAQDNVNDCVAKGRMVNPPARPDWPVVVQSGLHHLQKLRSEQVLEIRKRLAAGNETQKQIGASYGVSENAIGNIKRGVRWAHL